MPKIRTALVTGASRGIGHAVAERLKLDGCRVLAPSRSVLNLASNESIKTYLSGLKDPIDILVNNAGINPLGTILDVSDSDICETMQVNLVAPMYLMRGIARMMKKQKYGRIVNIGSIWGLVSRPARLVYSASKAGVIGLTRAAAVELAQYNVLVNAVAPGYVNTELTRQNNTKSAVKEIAKTIPVKRLAEPAEIAAVVVFLCSETNNYIVGQTILVDGGYACL